MSYIIPGGVGPICELIVSPRICHITMAAGFAHAPSTKGTVQGLCSGDPGARTHIVGGLIRGREALHPIPDRAPCVDL